MWDTLIFLLIRLILALNGCQNKKKALIFFYLGVWSRAVTSLNHGMGTELHAWTRPYSHQHLFDIPDPVSFVEVPKHAYDAVTFYYQL